MTNRDNLRADFLDDGLVKFTDGTVAMWCDFSAAWRPIAREHHNVVGFDEHKHTTTWGGRAAEYLHAIDVEVDSGLWAATMIDAEEGFSFILFSRHAIAHDVPGAVNRFVGDHDTAIDIADTMASEDLRVVYGFAGPFATREDAEGGWRESPGQTSECLAWRTRFGWFYASA